MRHRSIVQNVNRFTGFTLVALLGLGGLFSPVAALTSPAEWYEQAPSDTDGNKLDDYLDAAASDTLFDVFICFRYDCIPADRVAELEEMGLLGYLSTSVAALQVYDISLADLQLQVATWPEVGFVCPNEAPDYFMTQAGEALKAHSGHYSPNTCEDQGNDGAGVTIAIVDSGVDDLAHPDLPAAVGGIVMINGQTGQYALGNPIDQVGHGSMVAGCALGRGGFFGLDRGTAPGASLFDARISDASGQASMASILAITDWLLMNWMTVSPPIGVVNYSVGFDRESDGFNPLTQAINQFRVKGITAVAAIGNHGTCATTSSGATAGVGHVAVASNALVVGSAAHNGTADRSDDTPTGFSRVGPGRGVHPKPDIVAYGGDCSGACPSGCQSGTASEPVTATNNSGGYSSAIGTSFAAPQVAGLCACFQAAHLPLRLSPQPAIRLTAEDIGPPGWDSATGYGIIDPAAIEGMGKPIPPVPPDLAIQYVNYAPQPIVCGQPTLINVTVENVGTVPVDSFRVDFKRYYFGPNSAPAVLFDIGNGPEWNTGGPLLPDSIRTFIRWWTPGVSDNLPVSQHSCFWGIVQAANDADPSNNRKHKNFNLTGLNNTTCGSPPPGPSPPKKGGLNQALADDGDVLEIPLAVSHDKGEPLEMEIVLENSDPGNWHMELVTDAGDVGLIVPVFVDPQECLTWVTLRAYPLDPLHEGLAEAFVIASSFEHGILGDATILIDPTLSESCCVVRGDVTGDGLGPDITDLIFLVTYMFQEGAPPDCLESTDINGDGLGPDISDLIHLVTYMFQEGEPPVPCN